MASIGTSHTYILRKARMNAGMTQQELAAGAGIPLKSIIKLENEERTEWLKLSVRTLFAIARTLDLRGIDLIPRLTDPDHDERT